MNAELLIAQGQNSAPARQVESAVEWPTLLARMLEDVSRVIQLELQLLEARIAPSLMATVDRAIAGLILLYAGAIGGICLLGAFVLLLHRWMQWWQCLGIGGVVAISCGFAIYWTVKSVTASS